MSLYIDHDPFVRKKIPSFCRLFSKIDNPSTKFDLENYEGTVKI
jgi:hypothetical protein